MVKIATVCYIYDKEKVLMMQHARGPFKGKWNVPGGKIQEGESARKCVIREVQEETGLKIDPEFRGVLTFLGMKDQPPWYVLIYEADGYEGKLKHNKEEHSGAEWVHKKEFLKKDVHDDDKYFVSHLFSGKSLLSAMFYYDNGDKVVRHKLHKS